MKIAILDDEHTHLQMVEQALVGSDNQWGEGIECRFFSSGVALLEVIKREFFDCLILDRRVTDMSGDFVQQSWWHVLSVLWKRSEVWFLNLLRQLSFPR